MRKPVPQHRRIRAWSVVHPLAQYATNFPERRQQIQRRQKCRVKKEDVPDKHKRTGASGCLSNPLGILNRGRHGLLNKGGYSGLDIEECSLCMPGALVGDEDPIELDGRRLASCYLRYRNVRKGEQGPLDVLTPRSAPHESKPKIHPTTRFSSFWPVYGLSR